ncbi:hypothetical protein [Leptolyngbya sp. FACHB-17]|uniref:hypothetical protein n=1 Tax=unclassified Leptolyngbya TaxID=2650499 RepID=UPI001681B6CB|nr:hypothetical protein [Leptolyngbya sp. FACHB-17]MBD2082063.1 hypothetical protein [Leptolyngbya sp. FACHB-17]
MLNTENLLHRVELLHRVKLSPDSVRLAIEYAKLSAVPDMTAQISDRLAQILELATQHEGLDFVLNEIDDWYLRAPDLDPISSSDQSAAQASMSGSMLDVLRRYALLSSQPVLSEDDVDQISEILELAETNDGLALLLSQVDQALLESTNLLSDDAQSFYADQTSRILEFLTPLSETSCSKELLNLLLDQCARSDSSFVLSIEDPPLPWVITPPMSYSKSRPTMRQRAGFLIAALTTGAALMTGLAIVSRQCFASILQISSLPWETVKTSTIKLSPPVYPSASARLQPSSSTERQATVSKTALLNRQQSEEDQQFSIEQAQLQAEQRQREAELKQIVAEKQNQYQEAQYWYHQAQHWYQQAQHHLSQSRML